LEATIKVGSPEALIVVGQGEARTFKAGDTMFKGVQISSVDSEGVTLRLEKKTIRLTVGQEISI
jgi:hypothetical protein